jgi:uncharacterized membrane protein
MLSVNVKTAVTLAILGSVVLILLIPLYRGKVKRNPVYVIRLRKAFESEENWYKINRYGAAALMYWATFIIIMGIVCLSLPSQFVHTIAKFGILLIIIPLIQILRYGKKLLAVGEQSLRMQHFQN